MNTPAMIDELGVAPACASRQAAGSAARVCPRAKSIRRAYTGGAAIPSPGAAPLPNSSDQATNTTFQATERTD